MPVPTARPEGRPHCAPRCGAGVCAARGDAQRFDVTKVARMQEALRRGRFEINAEVIADRLLARTGLLGSPLN